MKKTLVIPAEAAPGRIDKYLGQELNLSRARLKALFDEADEKMYACKKQMHGER